MHWNPITRKQLKNVQKQVVVKKKKKKKREKENEYLKKEFQ